MSQVVVFGNSDWADMAHVYLANDSPHEVVAFTVDRAHLKSTRHRGLPVVAFEDLEKEFPPDECRLFIPMSYAKMNRIRAARFDQAKTRGYRFISYISSKAMVGPDFACGDNCFILEGTIIQPFASIGHDVVIMAGTHIGHHTVIQEHVTVTCQVTIAGCCTIEPYCFFGVNATVRDHIVVAEGTLVGAGATILANTDAWQVYKAVPSVPLGIRSDALTRL